MPQRLMEDRVSPQTAENLKDLAILVAWSVGAFAVVRFSYRFIVGGIEASLAEKRRQRDEGIAARQRELTQRFPSHLPTATKG
jgi:hypothetical protein